MAKKCTKPKRAKDYNYHKEKMLLCKKIEQGVKLSAEEGAMLDDTDDDISEHEFEAHYSYMAKIQEVPSVTEDDTGPIFDPEPLEKVHTDDVYNVFANEHSDHSNDLTDTCMRETVESNTRPDPSDTCNEGSVNDHDADEYEDERVVFANLVANLKLDIAENKKIQKQLKKANATLTQERDKCLTDLNTERAHLSRSIQTLEKVRNEIGRAHV